MLGGRSTGVGDRLGVGNPKELRATGLQRGRIVAEEGLDVALQPGVQMLVGAPPTELLKREIDLQVGDARLLGLRQRGLCTIRSLLIGEETQRLAETPEALDQGR